MKIYNFLLHLFCSRLTFISCQELKLKSFSSAWWDIEKGPESIFDEYRSRSDIIKLRKVDIDDNLIHTCYEYAFYKKGRLNRKNTFCYPAVVITGVRKCSTSALYGLLSGLPGAVQLKSKENCAFIHHRSLLDFFDSLPSSVRPGDIIIDGCIDIASNLKMRKILLEPNTFYVLLTRDFSDWIWSAYNYWCSATYDKGCHLGTSWAIIGSHNRTAIGFHEIVAAAVKKSFIPSPLHFEDICGKSANFFQSYFLRLRQGNIADEARILLAAEDMEYDVFPFWNRLAVKSGLPLSHPSLGSFMKVRYNPQSIDANARNGEHPELSTVPAETHKAGQYEISHFKPLLAETRQLLNKCWRQDCLWVSRETEYAYTACQSTNSVLDMTRNSTSLVSVESSTTPVSSTPSTRTSTSTRMDTNTHTRHRQSITTSSYHGYLYRYVRECKELLKIHTAPKLIASVSPAHSHRVLIISNGRYSKYWISRILNTVLQQEYVFVLGSSEAVGQTLAQCEDFKRARAMSVSADDILDVVKNGPSGSNGGEGGPTYSVGFVHEIQSSFTGSECDVTSEVFNSIVIVQEDPLLVLWQLFLVEHNRGPEYDGSPIDWTKWDQMAIMAINENKPLDFMATLRPSDFYAIPATSVFSGKKGQTDIQKILELMGFGAVESDRLRCTFALTFAEVRHSPNSTYFFRDYRVMLDSLSWIYSSDAVVCRKREILLLNNYTTLASHFFPQVKCGPGALPQLTDTFERTCNKRYSRRDFMDIHERRPPLALVAMPSQDLINARILVEQASGYYTGSITTNYSVLKYFPAEQNCGQRMPIIYTYPPDLTIKRTRAQKPAASLNSYGTKKCGKGMVRGFFNFILLIDDPYMSIWSEMHAALAASKLLPSSGRSGLIALERNVSSSTAATSASASARARASAAATSWNDHTSGTDQVNGISGEGAGASGSNSSSHHHPCAKDPLPLRCLRQAEPIVKSIAEKYTMETLLGSQTAKSIVQLFDDKSYMVMSYSALLHKSVSENSMRSLLAFTTNGGKNPLLVNDDRIRCAHTFVRSTAAQSLAHAVKAMREQRSLVCIIKKILHQKFAAVFLRHVLFADLDCSVSSSSSVVTAAAISTAAATAAATSTAAIAAQPLTIAKGGTSPHTAGTTVAEAGIPIPGISQGDMGSARNEAVKAAIGSASHGPTRNSDGNSFVDWLTGRLLSKRVAAERASQVAQLLVAAEVDAVELFASIPSTSFNDKYLEEVGITTASFGPSAQGLRVKLMSVHRETVTEHQKQT